jgi:hypothetical protein
MVSSSSDINTTNVDLSHYIQREILIHLRQRGPSSYQELKPDGMEGNAYNYHLRLLKQTGLIEHTQGKYSLTHIGYLVSDAYSYASRRLMLRPHMYTALLVVSVGKVLVYRHLAGPLKGRIGLPSGKLHYGESFMDSITKETARRLLSAEYTATILSPFNPRYTRVNQPVVHRPGMLWHVEYDGPLAERETANGRSCWKEQEELMKLPELLPEVSEGLKRLSGVSDQPIDFEYDL